VQSTRASGDAALDAELAGRREALARLARRQRFLGVMAVAVLPLCPVKGAVPYFLARGTAGSIPIGVASVVAIVSGLAALALAARWGRRIREMRAAIAALETTRDVLDHPAAPYLYRAPRRSPAAASAARARPVRSYREGWGGELVPLVGLALVGVVCGVIEDEPAPSRRHYTFLEQSSLDALGFVTPVHAAGEWALEDHAHATGGRALVNRVGAVGASPALAVVGAVSASDLRAETRCKFMPGHNGRACGLVFRYADPGHYGLARLDGAGVTVVDVVEGVEAPLGAFAADIEPGVWHELGVVATDKSVSVSWNGRAVVTLSDQKRPDGRVGLWAPADAHVWFDELAIEVEPRQPALELLPLLRRRG